MFQLDPDLVKHAGEFRRAIANLKFERTEDGSLFFPKAKLFIRGAYVHNVNGLDERTDANLIPTEGLNHVLDVTIGGTAKISAWYLALYGAATSPLAAWTASNFTSNSTEITGSSPEGYSESTRVAFVPAAASGGAKSNLASKAAFTIVTASTLTVNGCGLLSASAKGATTGTLYSASRFASARSLSNADVFNLGYTVTGTSS